MTEYRFDPHQADHYMHRLRSVQGWLHYLTAEILLELSRFQVTNGMRGAVAEIGVHHGKLFLLLYLSTAPDEPALAIDIFGMQELNYDRSGRGNKRIFLRHVDRLAKSRDGLELIEDNSTNITPERLAEVVGKVRFFSVDGGHTEDVVLNDIRLADQSLTEHGIIAVDDYFQSFWPEVSVAVAEYLLAHPNLVPFAIVPNKVLLCRASMRQIYENFLAARFPRHVDKWARFYGHDVPIIGIQNRTVRLRRAIGATKFGGVLKQIRDLRYRA